MDVGNKLKKRPANFDSFEITLPTNYENDYQRKRTKKKIRKDFDAKGGSGGFMHIETYNTFKVNTSNCVSSRSTVHGIGYIHNGKIELCSFEYTVCFASIVLPSYHK